MVAWRARARRVPEPTGDEGRAKTRPTARTAVLIFAPLALIGTTLIVFKDLLSRAFAADSGEFLASSKFSLYLPALRLFQENWLVGTSPGSFRNAVGAHLTELAWRNLSVTHVENIVLQTMIDHGLLVGGVLLAIGAAIALLFLAPLLRGQTTPLAFFAVFFIVLGDLVDFSLEVGFGIWALAFALGLSAGALDKTWGVRVPTARAAIACVLLIVLVVPVARTAWTGDSLRSDRALRESDERRSSPHQVAMGMARHPHDGYLAYRMAVEARRAGDLKSALVWINRAILLWPTHASAHVEAARALLAVGAIDQATLEYRLAARNGRPMLAEVVQRVSTLDRRLSTIPKGDHARHASLCEIISRRRAELVQAAACYDRLAERSKVHAVSARRSAAELSMRSKDVDAARKKLAAMALRPETAALFGQLILLEDGERAAFDRTAADYGGSPATVDFLMWRLELALRLGELGSASALTRQLQKRSLTQRDRRRVLFHNAGLLERAGQFPDALLEWRRIVRRFPRDLGPLSKLCHLELRLGLLEDARSTHGRMRAIAPEHPEVVRLQSLLSRQ